MSEGALGRHCSGVLLLGDPRSLRAAHEFASFALNKKVKY